MRASVDTSYADTHRNRQRRGRTTIVVAILGLLVLPSFANADFRIEPVSATIEGNRIEATANLELSLSNETEEALDKGIPLSIVVELALLKARPLLWKERIDRWRFRVKIRYHALSGRYIIEQTGAGPTGTDSFGSFRSLADALATVGGTQHFSISVPNRPLDDGSDYRLSIRARLDIESLPVPLRLVAYISPSWRLGSGWNQWNLEQ